ncbi:MAG: DUF4145 domain-containing protein [Anaerolineales bacterium]
MIPVIEVEETGPDEISRTKVGELEERWELFQCLACDSITVRVGREDVDEGIMYFTFHPERLSWQRKPRQYQKIPANVRSIYMETIEALNRQMPLLCAAGLRALIEAICKGKGIDRGMTSSGQVRDTLEGMINGLTRVVPEGIVANLHPIRFLGNNALHELAVPDRDDLDLTLTVLEDIMNIVYDLDYRADLLAHKILPAKRRARKSTKARQS